MVDWLTNQAAAGILGPAPAVRFSLEYAAIVLRMPGYQNCASMAMTSVPVMTVAVDPGESAWKAGELKMPAGWPAPVPWKMPSSVRNAISVGRFCMIQASSAATSSSNSSVA